MSEELENTAVALQETYIQPLTSTTPSEPSAAYYPMLQGTGVNKMRLASNKIAVMDKNGNITIDQKNFKLFMRGGYKLTTGVKMLFDLGCIKLTSINHYRPKAGQPINTIVYIPLEEYAYRQGYSLTPRATSSKEEEEAEILMVIIIDKIIMII